ncbi:hypothetical protein INR49_008757 [Caranx melampygus]|nr:hypothetical protein INR49_008757 [Caranx melampygus]
MSAQCPPSSSRAGTLLLTLPARQQRKCEGCFQLINRTTSSVPPTPPPLHPLRSLHQQRSDLPAPSSGSTEESSPAPTRGSSGSFLGLIGVRTREGDPRCSPLPPYLPASLPAPPLP